MLNALKVQRARYMPSMKDFAMHVIVPSVIMYTKVGL